MARDYVGDVIGLSEPRQFPPLPEFRQASQAFLRILADAATADGRGADRLLSRAPNSHDWLNSGCLNSGTPTSQWLVMRVFSGSSRHLDPPPLKGVPLDAGRGVNPTPIDTHQVDLLPYEDG
jgi:hypothetical protein